MSSPAAASPSTPDPIDAIVQRAAGGDEDALSELLGRHSNDVRTHIKHSIGKHWQSALDEDDVMQVTFVEAFSHIHVLQNRTVQGFTAWLRRIADNNLRDAIRALEADKRPDPRKRAQAARSSSTSAAFIEMLGATNTTPSRVMAQDEAESAMERALKEMPTDYATVIRMYDLQGKSIEETASTVKKSHGAVYMMRARAHDRLRELMGSPSQFFSQG
ncbi:MAG: RNA polymerase sigma factor [Phycisphaerales bacterium]